MEKHDFPIFSPAAFAAAAAEPAAAAAFDACLGSFAGVGKIRKKRNRRKGKSEKLLSWLGEVGGAPDWCKMISAIIGTFLNGFWPRLHCKQLSHSKAP